MRRAVRARYALKGAASATSTIEAGANLLGPFSQQELAVPQNRMTGFFPDSSEGATDPVHRGADDAMTKLPTQPLNQSGQPPARTFPVKTAQCLGLSAAMSRGRDSSRVAEGIIWSRSPRNR